MSDMVPLEGNTDGKDRPKLTLEVGSSKGSRFLDYYGTGCPLQSSTEKADSCGRPLLIGT